MKFLLRPETFFSASKLCVSREQANIFLKLCFVQPFDASLIPRSRLVKHSCRNRQASFGNDSETFFGLVGGQLELVETEKFLSFSSEDFKCFNHSALKKFEVMESLFVQ